LQRLGVQDPAAGGEDAYQQIVAEARSTLLHRAEPYPDWNPHGFVNKLLRRICLQWMTPGRSRVEPPGFPTHDRDQRMSDYLSAGIDETAQLALAESDTLFFVRCRVVANELGESGRLVVDRWGKPHPRAEKIHAIVLAILDRVEAGQMVDPALWHPAGGTSPFEQALSQILVATARDEDERRFWRDGREQARRKKLSIRLLLDTQAVPSLIREMQSRGMWSGDGPGSLRAV
jgi:hypothetical protein